MDKILAVQVREAGEHLLREIPRDFQAQRAIEFHQRRNVAPRNISDDYKMHNRGFEIKQVNA